MKIQDKSREQELLIRGLKEEIEKIKKTQQDYIKEEEEAK